MLSDDERKRIETHAIAQIRAQWGRVNPRALGDVVAEIRTRIDAGTWGQRTFAEQIDAVARLYHAHNVYVRDEAASSDAALIKTLVLIEETQGASGVRDYAEGHGLDFDQCARLLDSELTHQRNLDGPEFGD